MSIEAYTLTIAVLAAISLLWWIVAEFIEKRQNTHLLKIIREQDKKIKELQDENLQYYGKFGIIKKGGEE